MRSRWTTTVVKKVGKTEKVLWKNWSIKQHNFRMFNIREKWALTKFKIIYNEEFDPGSGWTLAAGLTHASRTVTGKACFSLTSGARVRNAYATYLHLRDSPEKSGLTPHSITNSHVLVIKGYGWRWACVPLVSWWGNGSPRPRWVGVLRGLSPTLVLRHGPDSYGRQQWGILVNGRKSEPAMPRAGWRPYGL